MVLDVASIVDVEWPILLIKQKKNVPIAENSLYLQKKLFEIKVEIIIVFIFCCIILKSIFHFIWKISSNKYSS